MLYDISLIISVYFLAPLFLLSFFFFFNDTATIEIYTLSLHDALPISRHGATQLFNGANRPNIGQIGIEDATVRSEEHTSELQSHSDLVCRLLLEKKKKNKKKKELIKKIHPLIYSI